MIEKRFMLDDAGELIDLNNHQFIDYGDEVCNLLNELHEENEQLKHDATVLICSNQEYRKENEQLKKENYELHKRLGDFEPFEEHIKERTSKTSVNDIIGLVKTDEPTNSVELKKELYK